MHCFLIVANSSLLMAVDDILLRNYRQCNRVNDEAPEVVQVASTLANWSILAWENNTSKKVASRDSQIIL